jgi:hypothetical protein
MYPAASLTQHVSGQMSKNSPFNKDNNRNRKKKKKKSSTSIQSSLLLLALPSLSWLLTAHD